MFKKFITYLMIFCMVLSPMGIIGCSSNGDSGTRDVFELFKGAFNDEAIRDIFVTLVKEFDDNPDPERARRIVLFWDLAAGILRRLGMTLSDSQIAKLKEQLDDDEIPKDFGKTASTQLALVNANVKTNRYITEDEFENAVLKASIKNHDKVQQAISARNAAASNATAKADKNAIKGIDYVTRLNNGSALKDSIEFDVMVSLTIQYLTNWSQISNTLKGKAANAALQLASFLGKDTIKINELQTKIDNSNTSEETLAAITMLLNN